MSNAAMRGVKSHAVTTGINHTLMSSVPRHTMAKGVIGIVIVSVVTMRNGVVSGAKSPAVIRCTRSNLPPA